MQKIFYSSITLILYIFKTDIYILLDYVLDYFSFIIDGCKFTSIAQTVTAELTYGLHVRGITPLRKLNNFSRLIMCSIWTLEVATHLVAVDARADTLFLPIIGGAISTVPCKAKRSWILKPLSAITASPGFSFSRKPLTFTISLTLILPLYNFATKLKCKIGDIEISNLKGIWGLVFTVGRSLAGRFTWCFNKEFCTIYYCPQIFKAILFEAIGFWYLSQFLLCWER